MMWTEGEPKEDTKTSTVTNQFQEWTCDSCTMRNKGTRTTCEACSSKAPERSKEVMAGNAPDVVVGRLMSPSSMCGWMSRDNTMTGFIGVQHEIAESWKLNVNELCIHGGGVL